LARFLEIVVDEPRGEATRDALSNAQVEFVVLEDCGHFWQECPDEFFPRVRSFLELASEP
jgi:pimeloyl-ACP methyl ester carboxylesterase